MYSKLPKMAKFCERLAFPAHPHKSLQLYPMLRRTT